LRSQFGAVLIAFTRRDDDGLTEAIMALGVARQRVDRVALRADGAGLLDRYQGVGLGEVEHHESGVMLSSKVDEVATNCGTAPRGRRLRGRSWGATRRRS